jgi:hypothetical protein
MIHGSQRHLGPKETLERGICVGLVGLFADIVKVFRCLCRIDREAVGSKANMFSCNTNSRSVANDLVERRDPEESIRVNDDLR